MTVSSGYRFALLCCLYALLVLVAHQLVLPSPVYAARPTLLGAALLFDLTVWPLLACYWLLARPQRWSWGLLALVGMALFRLAMVWLPDSFVEALPSPVLWISLLEGLALSMLVIRLRTIVRLYGQQRRTQDAATAWRSALSAVVGKRLAGFIASEAEVMYYALVGWRLRVDVPVGAMPLTSYRESGQLALLWSVLGISGIELVAMHVALLRWAPAAADWATLLSGYGCLLLLAVMQTIRKRPTYLTADALHLRLDVRWQAVIRRDQLAAIRPIFDNIPNRPGLVNAALLSAPNVHIVLNEPVRLEGLYGTARWASELTLFVDDRKTLLEQLATSTTR